MTFEGLEFRHPWRRYQRLALDRLEGALADDRVHLVAPPGSGKTVLGLELIRRFDRPALVLVPTNAIRTQWVRAVGMFADAERIRSLTSSDPLAPRAITVLTYQALATIETGQSALITRAEERWAEELVAAARVDSHDRAVARIALLRRDNPDRYRRQIGRRTAAVRREVLRDGGDVLPLLHHNARTLIGRLAAHGVGTVVLDECHHLLDHWALVVRALIDRLDRPRLIGLTATLPAVEDGHAYDNYTSLLGDVDIEVPTPAVVRSGDLAPYRDLVHFVNPSAREQAYLDDVQGAFDAAVAGFESDARFRGWVTTLAVTPEGKDGLPTTLGVALRERPERTLAALRFLHRAEVVLPRRVRFPVDATRPMSFGDWLELLEEYALDVLALSTDEADHTRLVDLRRVLLGFGYTLGERGVRKARPAADLVLAFSEAKDEASIAILAAESRALGEDFRGVVVTDYERQSSAATKIDAPLDEDAGSALRVFGAIVRDARTRDLDAVLVTGRTLLADADVAPDLLPWLDVELRDRGQLATCRSQPTHDPSIVEIVGQGPDWGTGTYVSLVTAAFEAGLTRCLVGTRGLLGEGWDSLRLNTLVDLTSVTTSTSVQQLRGRALRLDPEWPRKVAHRWDVICVAPDFASGGTDLRRFERRHERFWGIAITGTEEPDQLDDVPVASITRGVTHVSPELAWELATLPLDEIDLEGHSRRSLRLVDRREESYDLWRVGEDYVDAEARHVHVATDGLEVVPATWVRTRVRSALLGVGVSALSLSLLAFAFGVLPPGPGAGGLGVLAGFAALVGAGRTVAAVLNLRVVPDPRATLAELAVVVHAALRDVGEISGDGIVRITRVTLDVVEVRLEDVGSDDADVFAEALRDALAPITDQRYLVRHDLRDDRRAGVRAAANRFRWPAGTFAVPDALARNREHAEVFAHAFRARIGGDGTLTYTRRDGGEAVLLAARAAHRGPTPTLVIGTWR